MSSSSPHIRLFTAIRLPNNVAVHLRQFQNQVLKLSPLRMQRVPQENLHITLNFIGDRESIELDPIINVLSCIPHGQFEITLDHAFLLRKSSRALIWIEALEAPLVANLKETIDHALGLNGAERAYRPHVTLFRLRSARNLKTLSELINKLPYTPISFTGFGFSLCQSITTSSGVHYVELFTSSRA